MVAISSENLDIDNIDQEILSILIADAKTPYSEIAKRIYVSGGTVHGRMRKLEHMGIVKGSTLVIDRQNLATTRPPIWVYISPVGRYIRP